MAKVVVGIAFTSKPVPSRPLPTVYFVAFLELAEKHVSLHWGGGPGNQLRNRLLACYSSSKASWTALGSFKGGRSPLTAACLTKTWV